MTTYYAVRDPDTRALAGVMAETAQLRGPGDERLYFWVPSLGAWVLDDDILRDFRSFEGDRENAYEEIDPLQAAALIREAPALDRWTVAQFKTQPERLTSAELGLPVDVGQPRPTADPHTLESIEKAAPGAWVTVRTFPDDARGRTAARTWAYEIRSGKKKRLAALGPLEVDVRPVHDLLEARLRRAVTGEQIVAAARQLAERAHGLQVDKAGHPYIDHPRRVAERLERDGAPVSAIVAGWLHDVLEDTTLTAADLRAAGIPEDAIAAVEAVTKRAGESPADYAERIAATPLAADVKYADLADNTDPARVEQLDDATRERLEAKYALFRDVLARAIDRSRRHLASSEPEQPLSSASGTSRTSLRST